jgi:NAD(P)-dependent dehydrogenase (short-subunit alcohol dehydrogenase family)
MAIRRSSEAHFAIAGKTAFITGAARGIGAASAERLHSRGANVALVGLEPERLAEHVQRLGQEHSLALECDVTDMDALEEAVARTVERFGAIDIAIANAGIAFVGTLAGSPIEQIERTLAVNLLGVWRTDRAVARQIIASRGYILNVSSLAAIMHAPLMGAYTTAKAGVDALSDALRMELAPTGARVGTAYFGFIDTDIVRASYANPGAERMNRRMPAFLRGPAPLASAIDAIERGIEARAARVFAPRWTSGAYVLRGLLQPLTERVTSRRLEDLAAAMKEADASAHEGGEDLSLGISARALQGELRD